MMETFSITISLLALATSAITAWFTLFRRGTIRMTQPTVIFFGPDGIKGSPKVFIRTLLYSSAKKGQIIENMYVKLSRGESNQNFNVWVYGDRPLFRGSGLYVGENGVSTNHHFLVPRDGTNYKFLAGKYQIAVYATLVNRHKELLLGKFIVNLSTDQAKAIAEDDAGVYFDWGPDLNDYQSHTELHPAREIMMSSQSDTDDR